MKGISRLVFSLNFKPGLDLAQLRNNPCDRSHSNFAYCSPHIFLAPVTLTLTLAAILGDSPAGWGLLGQVYEVVPWVGSSSHLGIWRLGVFVLCRIAVGRGLQMLHIILESVQRCFVNFEGGQGLQGAASRSWSNSDLRAVTLSWSCWKIVLWLCWVQTIQTKGVDFEHSSW